MSTDLSSKAAQSATKNKKLQLVIAQAYPFFPSMASKNAVLADSRHTREQQQKKLLILTCYHQKQQQGSK